MNNDPIKCDECGKFIAYKDLEDGLAINNMHHEWDWYAEDVIEKIESICKRCNKKEINK